MARIKVKKLRNKKVSRYFSKQRWTMYCVDCKLYTHHWTWKNAMKRAENHAKHKRVQCMLR